MDRKRLIAIVAFIAAAALLGFGVYWFFFRRPPAAIPPPPVLPEELLPGPGLPEAREGIPGVVEGVPGVLPTARPAKLPGVPRLTALPREELFIRDPAIGARADQSGNLAFYNDADGRFYRAGRDGKIALLSDEVFFNVERVTWSPVSDESILEYPDGSNIYYNFQTKRQVTLPKHWEDFSFAGAGDRIAAKSIGFSPENRWLVTANPEGSGVSLVAPLGDNGDKVTVDWSPANQIVALSLTGEPLGGDREEVLFIGLHGENFKSTIVEGRGLQSRWSPDGKKLLYSVYSARSNFKPELWIVNAEGDDIGTGRRLLSIETWASKCSFADLRTVYCGVPEELPTGAGFAPALANSTPDRLWRIDTQTGARTEIPLQDPHIIDTLSITPDGRTLYFTDKNLSGVFQMNL